MAFVKTFRINPEFGIPDKDIKLWLNQCEEEAILSVAMQYIPALGTSDPRLTVIVTKLDDLPQISEAEEERIMNARSSSDFD